MSYKIDPLKTLKDKIKQPPAAEKNIVPRINSAVLFIGATGSGKSTLLVNLLNKKTLLGNSFDRTFLISPTAKSDDVQKHLKLDDVDIIDDLKDASEVLEEIMNSQRDEIIEKGAHKAPVYALIYDDVVGDKDLMKDPNFIKTFIACRHYNLTTMLCSQSYTAVPRKARLQAMNIFYFKGSNSEAELLTEEYSPPGLKKKEMLALIDFATTDEFSFLHINKRVPFEQRYRKNLDEIINYNRPSDIIKDKGKEKGKEKGKNSEIQREELTDISDPTKLEEVKQDENQNSNPKRQKNE